MNRTKIKQQARQLNTGHTWGLFLTVIIVKFLVTITSFASMLFLLINFALINILQLHIMRIETSVVLAVAGFCLNFVTIPLICTLDGLFVRFARTGKTSIGDGTRFCIRTSLRHFAKLLWAFISVKIITGLWSVLLVFPGIVAFYRYRFINQIIIDNPELSSAQARKICREITKGGKWKLFVLDLSFVFWNVISALFVGIPFIYVVPYQGTTNALYYENLKIKAIQEGRVAAANLNCAVVQGDYQPQQLVQQPQNQEVQTVDASCDSEANDPLIQPSTVHNSDER